jgi:hypothetical protein
MAFPIIPLSFAGPAEPGHEKVPHTRESCWVSNCRGTCVLAYLVTA